MKRVLGWVTGLFLLSGWAVGAEAAPPLMLDDIIRLHDAGVSDDIITSEIIVTESAFSLTADDIIQLKEAGFSDNLIQFLIDTGREDGALDLDGDEGEDFEDDGEGLYGEDAEYDEEYEYEGTTRTYLSLNYHYGSWWYNHYWWDYWYYDCGYYPFRFSYSWAYCGWYPTWYTSRHCHAFPYAAYRERSLGGWILANSSNDWVGFSPHALSSSKFKTNTLRGLKSRSIVARTDLASRDFSSDKIRTGQLDSKRVVDRINLSDSRDDRIRPVKHSRTRTVRDAEVRKPASGPRPAKAVKPVSRRPGGTKSGAAVEPEVRRSKRSTAVQPETRRSKGVRAIENAPRRAVKRGPAVESRRSSVRRAPAVDSRRSSERRAAVREAPRSSSERRAAVREAPRSAPSQVRARPSSPPRHSAPSPSRSHGGGRPSRSRGR